MDPFFKGHGDSRYVRRGPLNRRQTGHTVAQALLREKSAEAKTQAELGGFPIFNTNRAKSQNARAGALFPWQERQGA